MRLEHQIKNVLNRVDEARSDHTPGQEVGHPEQVIYRRGFNGRTRKLYNWEDFE